MGSKVRREILGRHEHVGGTLAINGVSQFISSMGHSLLLKVEPPNRVVRVSEYIDSIEQFIGKIENSGYAYKAGDGSTLFDVGRYEENFHYRPLSRRKGQVSANVDTPVVEDVGEEGEGDTQHHVRQKRNAADFALWKSDTDTADAGGRWDSSALGRGRPGWHIECSAMTWYVILSAMEVSEKRSLHWLGGNHVLGVCLGRSWTSTVEGKTLSFHIMTMRLHNAMPPLATRILNGPGTSCTQAT